MTATHEKLLTVRGQAVLAQCLAVLLGAFLLFQVQPLLGKFFLPWFGGSATVWSVCMLFFQTILLAGYAYAHWLSQRMTLRTQVRVHLAVVAAAVAVLCVQAACWALPLFPGLFWKPTGADAPHIRLLGALLVAVGIPGIALAATSPLMQAWYAAAAPERSPYRLYALSNAGSLGALLSYPFLVEPLMPLPGQSMLWSILFGLFGLCTVRAGWLLLKDGRISESISPIDQTSQAGNPRRGLKATWILLAFCGSVLLLGTTNQLCQEVAVMPFLWVAPLAAYLLTFVLTFRSSGGYSRVFWIPAFAVTCGASAYAFSEPFGTGIALQGLIFMFTMFSGCMVCHGELVRLKPLPRHLTSFYMSMSIGGALGGAAVSLAAPVLLTGIWELHLGLTLTWLALAAALFTEKSTWHSQARIRFVRIVAVAAAFLLGGTLFWVERDQGAVPIVARRDFYGLVRVFEYNLGMPEWHLRALYHGATKHGLQFQDPELKDEITSYYGPDTGIGLAILFHPKRMAADEPIRVGVVGLGVGTVAAYANSGDQFRFYEISPAVIELSTGDAPVFTYLADSSGEMTVVPGDARVSLERELDLGQVQQFDVLALDAFSSDSIPLHLITVEALRLYLSHLAPGGIIAIHISNRFLRLHPAVFRLADEIGWASRRVNTTNIFTPGAAASEWMILAQREQTFVDNGIDELVQQRELAHDSVPLWTDDYCSLLGAVRLQDLFRLSEDEDEERDFW